MEKKVNIKVINVRKNELNKRNYKSFEDWSDKENNIYIGRKNVYVKGTFQSKWHNPFPVKKYGLKKCLELFEEYLRNNKELWNSLEELNNKELGCWCYPEPCHGNILKRLLEEKINKNI